MSARIFDILQTSHATLVETRPLPQRASWARWINTCDEVHYEGPRQHTVSLYLDRGSEARRLGRAGHGFPGALCILPEGSYSDWVISGPFGFAHVYFDGDALGRFALEALDLDPRSLSLPDESFIDDAALRQAVEMVGAATSPLGAETALSELFAALSRRSAREVKLRGGLSRRAAARAAEYLTENLDRAVTLAELAAQAGLSEFHFQRMFRASFGCSPHRWQEVRRVEQARNRIAAGDRLADIAAACGFASQSHFNRVFKAHTGVAPGKYRAALL